MKVIIYAGSEYVTGDEIALALMDYSKALADGANAETAEIPILNVDGTVGAALFLVGPSSQIVVRDFDSAFDELIDVEASDRLRRLTAGLHPVAGPEERRGPVSWADDNI